MARIRIPLTDRLLVDQVPVPVKSVTTVELLPGEHLIEWSYVYPNHFREMKRLQFVAEADHRYHLGQKFFPAPFEGNPLEFVLDLTVDVVVFPVQLIFPLKAPPNAEHGDYFMWIRDEGTDQVLAGMAPDVPPSFSTITFVPMDEP